MAGRNIRAGAEKGGRWIVIRADAKRGFLLREGGFSVEASVIGVYYKVCIKLFLPRSGSKRVVIIFIHWHKMNATCIIVA